PRPHGRSYAGKPALAPLLRLGMLRRVMIPYRQVLRRALLLSLLTVAPIVCAQESSSNKAPTDPIARIRDEGLNRSQVMKTVSYLTDVIGPRLTGSPEMKRANEW